jgi:hypothetical protein
MIAESGLSLAVTKTFVEIDTIRHMDQNLRASWHGMPTDNLIIAEFDRWYMNLGQAPNQLHAFPESDSTLATSRR